MLLETPARQAESAYMQIMLHFFPHDMKKNKEQGGGGRAKDESPAINPPHAKHTCSLTCFIDLPSWKNGKGNGLLCRLAILLFKTQTNLVNTKGDFIHWLPFSLHFLVKNRYHVH